MRGADVTAPGRPPGDVRNIEPEQVSDANGSPIACTQDGCSEEAEFDVIETLFGVDLPGRPVCLSCAEAMGMREDADA